MQSRQKTDFVEDKLLHPPLKWAGGKRWLVPYLRPFWEAAGCARLVEPLCGGLAVSLGLRPERAWLNDTNEHLINFYAWLKKGLVISIEMANDSQVYYRNREAFNRLIDAGKAGTQEAAGYFYYLNRSGYNGLCRFNQSGHFNVPFGQYQSIRYQVDFSAYRSAFANWEFTFGNFTGINLQPSDFIYADPPYDVEFTQYSKEGFRWEDQVRLAEWLAAHPGPVILSNQATERICRLYKSLEFKLTFLQAPRMINSTGDRTPAREVLAVRGLKL